jgi:hypothetical protein
MVPLWLLEKEPSPNAIKLFCWIAAKYADHDTDAAEGFGRKELAELMGKSVDTVDRAKAELIEAGAIEIEERYHKGARLEDIYHLCYANPSRKGGNDSSEQPPSDEAEGGRKDAATSPHPCDHGGRTSAAPLTEPSPEDSSNEESLVEDPNQIAGDRLSMLLGDLLIADDEPRETIEGKVRSKRWRDAGRLIFSKDGRDPAEAEALLRWSQRDPFWRKNILSLPKFRDKYGQLRRAAESDKRQPWRPDAPPPVSIEPLTPLEPAESSRISAALSADLQLDAWITLPSTWLAVDGKFCLVIACDERTQSWLRMRYQRTLTDFAKTNGFTDCRLVVAANPQQEVRDAA